MFINVRHACLSNALLKFNFQRNISTTIWRCKKKKNFYETLGLETNCTQKEIKEAYINLSKVHHPDMPHNFSNGDKEFKRILEAYQVLSRPHSRTNYDNMMKGIHTVTHVSEDIVHRPFEAGGHRYSKINEDNYYGIKGVKKIANWKIVMACVIFCLTGIILQVIAITNSVTFNREILVKKTAEFNQAHLETRKEARENTNDENLIRILNRMKKNE